MTFELEVRTGTTNDIGHINDVNALNMTASEQTSGIHDIPDWELIALGDEIEDATSLGAEWNDLTEGCNTDIAIVSKVSPTPYAEAGLESLETIWDEYFNISAATEDVGKSVDHMSSPGVAQHLTDVGVCLTEQSRKDRGGQHRNKPSESSTSTIVIDLCDSDTDNEEYYRLSTKSIRNRRSIRKRLKPFGVMGMIDWTEADGRLSSMESLETDVSQIVVETLITAIVTSAAEPFLPVLDPMKRAIMSFTSLMGNGADASSRSLKSIGDLLHIIVRLRGNVYSSEIRRSDLLFYDDRELQLSLSLTSKRLC